MAGYLLLILYLCYLTVVLAQDYQTGMQSGHLPFTVWVIDTIDLFIHEAGHFIFGIFGRFVEILGGSLFQVLIPLATVWVFARANLKSLPFTLYWTGQSLVNVSVYIGDAPYQRLHLISRTAIHDWHWIFNTLGMMDSAEDVSSIVFGAGILVCAAGIGAGLYFEGRDYYRRSAPPAGGPASR